MFLQVMRILLVWRITQLQRIIPENNNYTDVLPGLRGCFLKVKRNMSITLQNCLPGIHFLYILKWIKVIYMHVHHAKDLFKKNRTSTSFFVRIPMCVRTTTKEESSWQFKLNRFDIHKHWHYTEFFSL